MNFSILCFGIAVQIFSERRGQWKAATQSQEFFRTLQRYYNNTYMDGDKQNAINMWVKWSCDLNYTYIILYKLRMRLVIGYVLCILLVRFLGHFQPQQGKPALWELDSDQHYNVAKHVPFSADDSIRYVVVFICPDFCHLNLIELLRGGCLWISKSWHHLWTKPLSMIIFFFMNVFLEVRSCFTLEIHSQNDEKGWA